MLTPKKEISSIIKMITIVVAISLRALPAHADLDEYERGRSSVEDWGHLPPGSGEASDDFRMGAWQEYVDEMDAKEHLQKMREDYEVSKAETEMKKQKIADEKQWHKTMESFSETFSETNKNKLAKSNISIFDRPSRRPSPHNQKLLTDEDIWGKPVITGCCKEPNPYDDGKVQSGKN